MVLGQGKIAEMKTGEGKTIVAPLATYMATVQRQQVHVVTVNDYLVQRDRDWTFPFFHWLGLTAGAIHPMHMQPEETKRKMYRCDVVYGTTSEFGFDYLRDNMKRNVDQQVQRKRQFAIVDEVDSTLIDEARTPLIISGPDEAFARIEALIENLDVAPPRAETELRFFQLEHAQAERMAQMFRPILLGRLQELMPDLKDQPAAVEVTAEPETNTLIVSAPVALQDVAQELVDRLDRSSYAGRRTFRTQRLDPSVADAEEIARNLRRLLGQTPWAGG